ncbi:hypothetical protein MMC21_004939 [Puttea exsequens]|nr:hypothetical protein [Puttea exsequens]
MAPAGLQGIGRHLGPGGLIALTWAATAFAAAFVAARTYIRLTRVGGLAWDDYWIYLAWTILGVNSVLQTMQAESLYYLDKYASGLVPADERLVREGGKYVRYEFVIIAFFWTVLWGVKASFLALYWKLFEKQAVYRRWWIAVTAVAFGAYVGCWVASALNCHPASAYFEFGKCTKASDRTGSLISVSYSTTVDVLTDLMIMLLPLHMLWKVRLTLRQKLGLAVVFLLAGITMIVAITRAAQISRKTFSDGVLLAVWGIIESTVSVIIGCLPPFKAIFRPRAASYKRYSGPSLRKSPKGSGGSKAPIIMNSAASGQSPGLDLKDMLAFPMGSNQFEVVKDRQKGPGVGDVDGAMPEGLIEVRREFEVKSMHIGN